MCSSFQRKGSVIKIVSDTSVIGLSLDIAMSQFSNILSKLNIDQGGVDIPMKKKTVHVSGKEVVFFNKLFDIVDYDGDDRVCFDSSSLSSRSMER